MRTTKAVITAAGRNQRRLPLQTVIDRDGYPHAVIDLFYEELQAAGIEEVAVVVAPGDDRLYQDGSVRSAGALRFVTQEAPNGYGGAVLAARAFTGDDPFLLMVNDHLYLSARRDVPCARQLVEAAERWQTPVSAVQATHESQLAYFGAIGGELFEGQPGTYLVQQVLEKPTPTQAEEWLAAPGLRRGYYLCFFGMHILPPSIMQILQEESEANPGQVSLSKALHQLARSERFLAVELAGRRYDLDQPYGLMLGQLALALAGKNRESVLASLVEVLAHHAGDSAP